MVDLLFWKTATVVTELNANYFTDQAESLRGNSKAGETMEERKGGWWLGCMRACMRGGSSRFLPCPAHTHTHTRSLSLTLSRSHSPSVIPSPNPPSERLRKELARKLRPTPGKASSLNSEGREKLLSLFESCNCSRANLNVITAGFQVGAGGVVVQSVWRQRGKRGC